MIVRKYLLSFILNIVLEGIFDNIDFKGENSANNVNTTKASNTNKNEIRKNSSNSNKINNQENNTTSNNQTAVPKKMMIIKNENASIKNNA